MVWTLYTVIFQGSPQQGRKWLFHPLVLLVGVTYRISFLNIGMNYGDTCSGAGFPRGLVVKNPTRSAGDAGSIPGSGRSPGGGNGNPLQYFCWRIPWTEEPGGLQFIGSQRVRHDWSDWSRYGGAHYRSDIITLWFEMFFFTHLLFRQSWTWNLMKAGTMLYFLCVPDCVSMGD